MVEIAGFAVGDEIGRGGFGVVYRARDLAFERDVAIKVLRDVPGTDLRRRFLAECRAVGSLGGRPGIPTVYSTGATSDGAPFMAMQLLSGGSLSERQPLPADAVIAVGRRLAEALQAAHDGGVIHRDVKPANVLFDADDQPVLVDFGISALVGEATNSVSENVAVSVAFAPPEVLAGGQPGVPGDVYALGATLFCALTGRAPFVSEYGYDSIAVIAARIATAQVEDLRLVGVPDGLARVIEIAMAKDPAARFASMSAFGSALADAGSAEPGPPLGPVLPSVARRPRRSALVAAGVAAVLLAGGATALALNSGGSGSAPVAATGRPSTTAPPFSGPVRSGSSDGQSGGSGAPGDSQQSLEGLASAAPGAGLSGGARPTGRSGGSATTPAGSGGRSGGTHSSATVLPPTGSSSARPTSAAPSPPNRRPTVSATGKTWNERASVSVPITVADPDGDAVTLAVSGLPSWLHLSGRTVSGVPPYNAASGTTRHTDIQARVFTLTITATDSHDARARAVVSVRIRDTLRTMPDYIGKTGAGTPTISAVSTPTKGCAYQKTGDGTRIYWQSVRPGTVIAWGRAITYRFGRNRTSCKHVSGHWPS